MSSLKELVLQNNQLRGTIPPELGDLNNLERLFLREYRLEGRIPSELGNIRFLSLGKTSSAAPLRLSWTTWSD